MFDSFVTLWPVAYQTPRSMGFPRQECWRGWPFPSPRDLPDPEIKPVSPALQVDSLPTELSGKPIFAFLPLDFGFKLVPGPSLSLPDFARTFAHLHLHEERMLVPEEGEELSL